MQTEQEKQRIAASVKYYAARDYEYKQKLGAPEHLAAAQESGRLFSELLKLIPKVMPEYPETLDEYDRMERPYETRMKAEKEAMRKRQLADEQEAA